MSFTTNNYTYVATATNAWLTVVRTSGLSGIISASYSTVGGTAMPGSTITRPTAA